MFGVHQPHIDHPKYPKWSATPWPRPYLREEIQVNLTWVVVSWDYFPAVWLDSFDEAMSVQASFNEVAKTYDWEGLYNIAEIHNKPQREIFTNHRKRIADMDKIETTKPVNPIFTDTPLNKQANPIAVPGHNLPTTVPETVVQLEKDVS